MIINKLLFQTDIVIALVFWLLILMSIVSWTIIIEKSCYFFALQRKLNNIIINRADKEPVLKEILGKILPANYLLMQDENNNYFINKKLNFGMVMLASIGSAAPFIGLFGTVWGIYFALINIADAGNASINIVAKPMGEALIATAFGLFAAIPAVIAFNFFKRIANDIRQKLNLILYDK